jgi:hypothetical protein
MILFFLGREHHAEKLMDLARAFDNVSFLIADNAINIDPPSMFLKKYGISNIVHLSKYFQGARKWSLGTGGLPNEINKTVSPYWQVYSVEEASRTIPAIENCLWQTKPEAVFLLHLNNFWASQIAQIAQKVHIPVFALQEGIILDREVNVAGKYWTAAQYADVVFSWSADDRDRYVEKNKVIPVGAPHLVRWLNRPKTIQYAFLPPRIDLYAGDFVKDFQSICQTIERIPNAHIHVKFHPYDAVPMRLLHPYSKCHVWEGNTYELLSSAKRVVTQVSTAAIESIALGAETVIVDTEYTGIGRNMPCPVVHNASLSLGQMDFGGQQKWLSENNMLNDGRAIEHIVNIVNERINQLHHSN